MAQSTSTHEGTAHVGPHIPQLQWERVPGFEFVSNTNVASFLFLIFIVIISLAANKALKKKKSKLKSFFLNIVKFSDEQLRVSMWDDKKFSRKYFPLIVWLFFIVFLGNIWGLIIDWLGASVNGSLFYYLRPIHSDLNTTVALALLVVVTFLALWVKSHWWLAYSKSFFFNFTGSNLWEKCINVFVWWLHFIWIWSTIASLSLRLFWNIFAWIVLIWVISYLWVLMTQGLFNVWILISIPFWFFEIFVAIVQALVFSLLTLSYLNQAKEEH